MSSNWEFSFFLNAGEPLYEAVNAVTQDLSPTAQRYIIAHEWLGLPVVFSALLRNDHRYKTIFYAHEVATARLLVEGNGGHDTRFYNVLRLGLAQGQSLDAVFGDQSWFYKHAMIQRAGVCDRIFAVGDPVVDELRFLGGVFGDKPIDLVYNGIPAAPISLEQKLASRELLLQYAENLYGFRPDYIFTHVTRMVPSKALWRDVRVLEHLEWTLAAQGKRAVTFIVSHRLAHRPPRRGRLPLGGRVRLAARPPRGQRRPGTRKKTTSTTACWSRFTGDRSAAKICLVNQFGWERSRCGWRMPEAMRFSRSAQRRRPGVRPVDLRTVRHRPVGAAEQSARCAWCPTFAGAWDSSAGPPPVSLRPTWCWRITSRCRRSGSFGARGTRCGSTSRSAPAWRRATATWSPSRSPSGCPGTTRTGCACLPPGSNWLRG